VRDVILKMKAPPPERLDASPITPDRLDGLTPSEIARVPLRGESGATVLIGDLFDVSAGGDGFGRTTAVLGDCSRLDDLGRRMGSGSLFLQGDVGRRLGAGMTAGAIEVRGNVGDGVGLEMAGGRIVVNGSVGRGAGSASPGSKRGMTGGELIVVGDAGAEAGACMRRGLIAVSGTAGPDLARAAIAGTVLVGGDIAGTAGRWSKRASVVALGAVTVPATYRFSCVFRPPHIALLLTHLRKTCGRFGFPMRSAHVSGRFERFSGDHADLGAGEILRFAGR